MQWLAEDAAAAPVGQTARFAAPLAQCLEAAARLPPPQSHGLAIPLVFAIAPPLAAAPGEFGAHRDTAAGSATGGARAAATIMRVCAALHVLFCRTPPRRKAKPAAADVAQGAAAIGGDSDDANDVQGNVVAHTCALVRALLARWREALSSQQLPQAATPVRARADFLCMLVARVCDGRYPPPLASLSLQWLQCPGTDYFAASAT